VHQFFKTLYGDEQQGWVAVVTFPARARKGVETLVDWKAMSLNAYKFFQWPQQADALVKYCASKSSEDVYVPVSLSSQMDNKKGSMMPPSVIHCEADTAGPSRFPIEPSIIVETSPGRWQLYWQLKEPAPIAKAEPLAKQIAYSQRAHGADMGWAVNKLMRVPGTTNTKPGNNKFKVTADHTGRIYTFKELKRAFAGSEISESVQAQDRPLPTDLPSFKEASSKMPPDNTAQDLMLKHIDPDDPNPKMRSRYKAIWNLACICLRGGMTLEETFVVCSRSVNNKYAQDGRSETELWRDILKADATINNDTIIFVDDDPDNEPIHLDVQTGVSLLKPEERELVRTDTFIDIFTDWARTKTLADHKYHRANAITILSTMLSEFGYGTPKHGSLGLELWFMVLGVTTRSYKTTAAKLMLRFLDHVGAEREHPYELESDVSPESLGDALADRGEISSLYHVDEAHATVGDAKGGKGYMAGLLPLLTKLYDGKVPGVKRMTRKGNKATKTHFTLSMLGVPGKMTETLTREDFASGFLARFIFVLGAPAPRDPENRWMDQAPIDAKPDMDPVLSQLLMDAQLLVAKWRRRVEKAHGEKIAIRVADDAWARWNKLVLDLDKIAESSPDPEAVLPTAERTTVAVHKLACLLAMADDKEVVQMDHLLTAIRYAEGWYDTMTIMSQMVFANRWQRQVSELVEWVKVSEGRRRSYTAAYKHFSGYKPKEFEEMVQTALQTGLLTMQTKQSNNGQIRHLQVPE
jgi:hypothetical protein